MSKPFQYDVFLSHSSKDKAVVRAPAERLKGDKPRVWLDDWEIQPGDNIPAKIEEGLERSRVPVLCMSANAFGSDWAQLESGTFRFRDAMNKSRRFLPLRLDDTPAKGSPATLVDIDWRVEGAYERLPRALRPGFDNPRPATRRKLDSDCMACHNASPRIPAGHPGPEVETIYSGDLPEGIDCQRCHGPVLPVLPERTAHPSASGRKAAAGDPSVSAL